MSTKGSDAARSPICSFSILSRSRVRVEADPFHADGAMETGGQAAGHDVLRKQRHADKAREAEKHEHDDDGRAGPAHPPPTAKTDPAESLAPRRASRQP